MTKDPVFGSLPRQAYSGSLLERAAALRGDDAKLAALLKHERAGVYVIGGESIVLKVHGAAPDPLFSPDEARALEPRAKPSSSGCCMMRPASALVSIRPPSKS